METLAERFAVKCADDGEVLYFDFDPKAVEDQEGDVGIITFSDGSRWFNDAASGNTWTA